MGEGSVLEEWGCLKSWGNGWSVDGWGLGQESTLRVQRG